MLDLNCLGRSYDVNCYRITPLPKSTQLRGRSNRRNKSNRGSQARQPQMSSGLTILRTPSGFPQKLMTTLVYNGTYGGTSAGLSPVIRQFSCNGMFDPDITGTGHQPMYFDQFMAIYDHYTVFRSHIEMRLVVTSNSSLSVLYIDDDTSTVSLAEQAAEQPSASKVITPVTMSRPSILRKSWDAKSFFGGDIYDNDNLQGNASANPVEQSYFTFVHGALDTGVNSAVYVNFTIRYEAVFDELKTQSQS